MTLRIRRGTQAQRDTFANSNFVFESGEPVFTTGTGGGKLYIGDNVTPGGVLINPGIVFDSEVAVGGIDTVIVDRSRSIFESDDTSIDLRDANNFRIVLTGAGDITFVGASIGSVSNGQSGYIIIDATVGSTNILPDATAGQAVFTPGGTPIAVANTGIEFVSYTVAPDSLTTSAVYLSSVTVATSA